MQTEHNSHPTSFSMRGTQTILTTRPPPDPISTYEPNHPESHYPSDLNKLERIWHDRYQFLLQMGFELRPRYRTGWIPSWLNAKEESIIYEDSLEHLLPQVMDAKRIKDGTTVCLKAVYRTPKEADIARYFSSPDLLQEPANHSVPILDVFCDPSAPDFEYLVMPLLRPFDDPEFTVIGEVVDFVTQILEGLAFMHSHNIAHGDCTGANIMMDARPIYPRGWHFKATICAPDGVTFITPLARIDHPVRYYFIDYGLSHRFLPGQSRFVLDWGGRDTDVPELKKLQPYDPFKVDVFTVGNMFFKDLYQKYLGLESLADLIGFMMNHDPGKRPSAEMALQKWRKIKAGLSPSTARWRLRKPDESVGERVVLDTIAVAKQGIRSITHLFNDDLRTW